MKSNNLFEERLRAYELVRLIESIFGNRNISWFALWYAALLLLAVGWIPDGVADIVGCDWASCTCLDLLRCSGKLIVSFVIFMFFRWRLSKAKKIETKINVKPYSPQKVKALGLFLSTLGRTPAEQDVALKELRAAIENRALTLSYFSKKTWEMPLNAIEYHKSELKKVFLFTSSGSRSTSAISGDFREVVRYLYPGIVVEEIRPGGMDFENVESVFNSVEDFYKRAEQDGYKDQDMLVDITGGQKTNSIAASIATLAAGRNFQYISTETKDVRAFDVRYME